MPKFCLVLLGVGQLLLPGLALGNEPSRRVRGSQSGAPSAEPGGSQRSDALSGEAVLSRNISLYESGRYEECVTALRQSLAVGAQTPKLRPEQVEQAQTYLAA